MTRRLNFWLFAFLFIVGFPFYWYLLDAGAGEARMKPLSMGELRALSGTIPGPAPTQLRAETIGTGSQSFNMLAAGTGLRSVTTAVRAYELVVPGKGPILIDAGTTRETANERDIDRFDPSAQNRVDRALRKASSVLILADDDLRNGGGHLLAAHQAIKTRGESGAPFAVAPGVVAVPLRGLTPGSLMVYARLADGREVLFTGEGANLGQSWRQLRPPARLAVQGMPEGYRNANLAWLITINALSRQAPQMRIVTGHESNPVPFSSGNFSD